MVIVRKVEPVDAAGQETRIEIEYGNVTIVLDTANAEELTDQLVELLDWGEILEP